MAGLYSFEGTNRLSVSPKKSHWIKKPNVASQTNETKDLFSILRSNQSFFSLPRLVWKMIDRNRSRTRRWRRTRLENGREKTISWKIENRPAFFRTLDDDITLNDGGRRLRWKRENCDCYKFLARKRRRGSRESSDNRFLPSDSVPRYREA